MDELKGKQVIARKRGYGPDYVNLFVKHHKDKMCEFARQHGISNPIDVGLDKWGLERDDIRGGEGKEGGKGGDKSTDAGLERACCFIMCQLVLRSLFPLSDFKCNIVALLTDCILYMKGLVAARNMP